MSFPNFDNWAVYTYELPLYKPIAARGSNRLLRKGILIFIRHEWGIGIGEAAPIEGFHPIPIHTVQEEILQALKHPDKLGSIHPISRCAIEMAHQQPLGYGSVPINGLVTHKGDIDPQFSCYKIKVGRQSVHDDIVMVRSILATLPSQTSIRLDANCAWTLHQCMDFWRGINGKAHNIEYIEEPLSNADEYSQIAIPFAFDERLSLFGDALHNFPTLRAIILKPSLLGLSHCSQWIEKATQRKVHAVISSTFESSIGLFAYAAIAQSNTHCGLGTNSWFKEDLLEKRATPRDGTLFIPQSNRLLHHPSLTCIDSG
ncbi:MAG: hypothetical protein CL916_05685 [Deltaproteobacteria bacterium]|nr:hypothetical protein [Deltaproteobacteria bacterium]